MRCRWSAVFLTSWIVLSGLGCAQEPPRPVLPSGADHAAADRPAPASPAERANEPPARTLRLPANLTAAAVNPENGDVAFVSLRSGQLWLLKSAWFDGDAAARIGPVTNVEYPSWVTFKRYEDRLFVVVGCFAAGPVRVFAADTLQGFRFAHNQRADAVWLSVSRNPADSLVYVSSRSNDKPAVSVVNLAAKQLQLHPLLSFGRSPAKVAGAVVSYSGRTLYKFGDDDQRLTAWRVQQPDSPEKPPRLERLADLPDDAAARTQPPIALPYDLGLLDGGAILLPQATPVRTALPVPASCVLDSQPLAFGLSGQQLSLASLDALRVLASRPVAAELFEYQPHEREIVARTSDSDRRFVIHPVVLADPGRNRILVLGNRDVQILPRSDLPPTDHVWLGLDVDLPRVITAGKPWTTQVRKTDLASRVRLQAAPDGMTLRDDVLAWTPPREMLGRATFTLRLEREEESVQHDLSVEVKGPALSCPFTASRVAVSPDGKRLIVWTNQNTNAELALIDPVADRVLAQRTISGGIVSLLATRRAVCLVIRAGAGQVLLSLDPDTLQTKGHAAVKVSEWRERSIGPLLRLRGFDQIVLDKCFSLPELKEVALDRDAADLPKQPDAEKGGGRWIDGRVDGGWCLDGVIWDDAVKQPRALLDLPAFVHHAPRPSHWDDDWPRQPASRSGSFDFQGTASSKAALDAHTVTPGGLPVSLELAMRSEGDQGLMEVELVARGRLDRKLLRRWPIEVLRPEPVKSYSYWLATDGWAAGVVLAGRVYAVDLSELQADEYAKPLAFVPVQSTLLANANGPTRLVYEASGGRPPYKLKAEIPGCGDSSPVRPAEIGLELEVDAAGYVARQRDQIARVLMDWSPATEGAEAILQRYCRTVAPHFRRLIGREPAGVPVVMPLEVTAADRSTLSAKFCHYLLIEIPPAELIPVMDADIAARWKGTSVAVAARERVELRKLIEFSDALRKDRPVTIGGDELEAAAQQAVAASDARWRQGQLKARLDRCNNPERIWTDATGRTARARLLSCADDVAVLVAGSNRTFDVPLDRLSKDDRQYVLQTMPADSPAAREVALADQEFHLKRVGRAVGEFHGQHGRFPPPALVAPDGTPLLSWRVLLLPHLEASDLYALFRLDEPWDSDHNRRLLQYLPAVYRIWGIDTEPTKTSLVTLRGPATAFPPSRLISLEDCRDGARHVLMAAIAHRESAVAWTQPTDLALDPEGRFVEQLDWRNEVASVLMCDATVRRLKRALPADAWVLMAGRDDGNPMSLP